MSSDTVTSRNALQFTNDNKKAYAYSGILGIDSTETSLLKFNTNSEYLNAKIMIFNESGSGDDMRYKIKFNNVVVVSTYSNSGNDFLLDTPIILIIPPFTVVDITADNISSGTNRNHTAHVWAKVGMPQRVGNE
tara:strand:- start:80 stop:481 length:402 start_codon:yes stop_codon:yes gene_type:complete